MRSPNPGGPNPNPCTNRKHTPAHTTDRPPPHPFNIPYYTNPRWTSINQTEDEAHLGEHELPPLGRGGGPVRAPCLRACVHCMLLLDPILLSHPSLPHTHHPPPKNNTKHHQVHRPRAADGAVVAGERLPAPLLPRRGYHLGVLRGAHLVLRDRGAEARRGRHQHRAADDRAPAGLPGAHRAAHRLRPHPQAVRWRVVGIGGGGCPCSY